MRNWIVLFSLLVTGKFFAQEARFTLPPLRFDYKFYEPIIDEKTMIIHHKNHHMAYINNLNKAIVGTPYENVSLEEMLINASKTGDAIRNNAGGHYNHSLFWEILSPKADFLPNTNLGKEVIATFGSVDSLKKAMIDLGMKRFGSGWVWLYVKPDGKLAICSTPNQDNPMMDVVKDRGIPILGIDVWEHAYYLKYQSARKDYLINIWGLIDWKAISEKYTKALNSPYLKDLK